MNGINKLFLICFIFALAITGCASYKHSHVDVRPVDSYLSKSSVEGISVAADPFDTTDKAKTGFYVDVTKQGFCPVLLILRNDTDDRVMFLKNTVELMDASNSIFKPVNSAIMSDACEHNKMAYAILGFGIFSYMSAEEANRKMAADWRDKELPDQFILLSRERKDGFLYFQLPQGKKIEGYKLKLVLENIDSKQKIPLVFNF